jgi:hypothetical protein
VEGEWTSATLVAQSVHEAELEMMGHHYHDPI